MPIQAFADDSGGKGHSRHFVVVGLVGQSEAWANFSDEWSACLRHPPSIRIFKMREAASCTGQFDGVSAAQRDRKLRVLAQIINRYALLLTHSAIDLNAHAETWAARSMREPQNEAYFWAFHNTIMATCFSLWDAGWRKRFEMIFDENVIFGPRAKLWYPYIKTAAKHLEPASSAILPIDPIFHTDSEFMPLQAADMFAWCFRKSTDDPSFKSFEWLLEHVRDVMHSEYSQYYDKERMQDVTADALRIRHAGLIPEEVDEVYRKITGGL